MCENDLGAIAASGTGALVQASSPVPGLAPDGLRSPIARMAGEQQIADELRDIASEIHCSQRQMHLEIAAQIVEQGQFAHPDTFGMQIMHEEREADLELALDYALSVLIQFEPGDSRAVSNEFVAAAVLRGRDGDRRDECRAILRAAIAQSERR